MNQYKQLCSIISPTSSSSTLNERDYSDIAQHDEEPTDDETEIAEFNFESQDPDFLGDHSVAHDSFRTKTKSKPIRKKPTSFELFLQVDTSDLIQKPNDFVRKADLDLQTLLEEQLNDPVFKVFTNGSEHQIQNLTKHTILTNQKPCCYITTSLNNFSSNRTLTLYATENHFKTLVKPRRKYVFLYRFSYHSFFSPYS